MILSQETSTNEKAQELHTGHSVYLRDGVNFLHCEQQVLNLRVIDTHPLQLKPFPRLLQKNCSQFEIYRT